MDKKIVNFRELGGLKTSDGARVKKNLLFRSGIPNLSSQELEAILDHLGIKRVYDLRSQGEVGMAPYSLPQSIGYQHRPALATIDKDLESMGFIYPGNQDMAKISPDKFFSQDKLEEMNDFMLRMYKEMGENPQVFASIIRDMFSESRGVLFHCSAGKDRTGALASFILLGLGVSKDDVLDHYLLSNDYRKEEIDREMLELSSLVQDEMLVDKIKDMFLVKEEYLGVILKQVDALGSFEGYALKRMGLSLSELEALREKYLE